MYRPGVINRYCDRHHLRRGTAKGRGLTESGCGYTVLLLKGGWLTYSRYYSRRRRDLVLVHHVIKLLVNLTIVLLCAWGQQKLHGKY